MTLFVDTFDGTDGQLVSARTGWGATPGYVEVLKINGSGAVRNDAYVEDPKSVIHDTGALDHYIKVVIGAGYVSSQGKVSLGVSQTGGAPKFICSYLTSTTTLQIRGLRGGSYQTLTDLTIALAAGDEIYIEQNDTAKTLVIKRNGATVFTEPDTSYYNDPAYSGVGFVLDYSGLVATDDIIRSFEANSLGGAPADTEAPTLTGTPTVGTKTSSTIDISWPAGSDDTAVVAYDVRINGGSWIDNGLALTYSASGLDALTSYTFEVTARDAAGNRSTPALSVTTSTYRDGALASTILLLTGPQGGNPAGFLYDFASTVATSAWLSYTVVSGPTPAGGSLDANAMGAFSYTGPAPATMVIQPEVNGANAPETITVTLYDNSVSLGAASMASTPVYGVGSVSQAAPVPLTGTAVAVASAYGSGQIAQGAPVVLAGAAFAVIPAMGNGAVSQGAPVALSGAALAVVPAMGAGGLVQGVPVALSATPFTVIPVFSAGALSQAAPVALMGAALSVSTAYGPGAISDAPTFTSMAPSPVCATYRRDSYPAHTFQKLAGETLDFDIDFRYELRSTQDSARIHDPVEIQAGQGVDVLGAYWVPGLRRVKLWITGGEAQGKSDISIWLNTAAGRRLQVDVRVQIK